MRTDVTAAGFGLVAAAAVAAHDYLSGGSLIRDAMDALTIQSRSLDAWEAHWERNPCRSDLVICLTTTPTRIPHLAPTLASLLYQTRSPRLIRLHVPLESRREGRPYEIPPFLAGRRCVEIVRCRDMGPATKLLPALADFAPRQPLLVVDDDRLYPPGLVDHFHRIAGSHADVAVGTSGWIVPADLTDRPTTLWSNVFSIPPTPVKCTRIRKPVRVDILQGFSGYLVRPIFIDPAIHDSYALAPPEAWWQDDVWISAHCRVPRYVLPGARFCFESWRRARFYRAHSLGRMNNGGGDVEKRTNTILIRHLRDRWMVAHCRGPIEKSTHE